MILLLVSVLGLYIFAGLQAINGKTDGLQLTCGDIQENKNVTCHCNTSNPIRWHYRNDYIRNSFSTSCKKASCTSIDPGFLVSYTGSSYILTILNFESDKNGFYYCVDDITSTSAFIHLFCPEPVRYVNMTPDSTTITVEEGKLLTLNCETSPCYPAANISWYKTATTAAYGEIITEHINTYTRLRRRYGHDKSLYTHSTLRLYPSKEDNGYSVYCSANNTNNHVLESWLKLNVRYAPIPLAESTILSNIESRLHDFVNLSLEVRANPEPQPSDYVWSKNEDGDWKLIEDSYMIRIVTNPLSTNLVFTNVQITDSAEYKLNVKNTIGMMQQWFTLTIHDVPTIPTNVSYIEVNNTPILRWNPGFNGGLQQTFAVLTKQQCMDYWTETNVTDEQQEHVSVILSTLESHTEYTARVYAFNSAGNSALTRGMSFITGGAGEPTTDLTREQQTPVVVIIGYVGIGVVLVGIIALVVFCAFRKKLCFHRDTDGKINHQQQMSQLSSIHHEEDHTQDDSPGAITEQNVTAEVSQYEPLGTTRTEPSTYMALQTGQEIEDGSYENADQTYVNTNLKSK